MLKLNRVALTGIRIDEIKELRHRHPGLKPNLQEFVVTSFRGPLKIDHSYNGFHIQDEFDVEILMPPGYPLELPHLKLSDERVARVMKAHNISDRRTLHLNRDGTACLSAPPDLMCRFPGMQVSIAGFVELVEHYLYALSYFEKLGRWPWLERSHGAAGVLESFAEQEQPTSAVETYEYLRDNAPAAVRLIEQPGVISDSVGCICRSGRGFAECHPLALEGLRRLKAALLAREEQLI